MLGRCKGMASFSGSEFEFTVTNPQKQVPITTKLRTSAIAIKNRGTDYTAVMNNRPETARTPDALGKHSTADGYRVSPLTCCYGGPERVLPPSTE